ncbi:MAG: carbohydrate ABC transporter permease, partial [Pseudomonadota bacterium]
MVVITFVFLSIMWSFWSSEDVGQWWQVMSASTNSGAGAWGWLLLGLAALYVLIVLKEWLEAKGVYVFFDETKMSFSEVASRTSVMALGVVLIGLPQVQNQLGEDTGSFIASLQETRLNDRDAAIEERGYYEGLMDNRSYTSQLSWSQQNKSPKDWKPIMETDLVRDGEGVIVYELMPNLDQEFKEVSFKTNQWGMRDQEYAKERAPNTLRIALLGASYEQGAGVRRDQTFEAVLEDTLNAYLAGSPYDRYEILNFATGGYSPVQNVAVAEEKMKDFQPDIVMYAMYSTEERRMFMQLENIVKQDRDLPYPFLNELIQNTGVTPGMEKSEIRSRLRRHEQDLLGWSFKEIAETSTSIGATPFISSIAAFGILQQAQPLRRWLVTLAIVTMLIPPSAVWLWRFELFQAVGIIDTLFALVFPAFAGGNSLFVLIYFWAWNRIPHELFEAGRLDGAGFMGLWWFLGLPLVRPATAAVTLLAVLQFWGSFIEPLLFIFDPSKYTLPVSLQLLNQLDATNRPLLMAAAV